MTEDRFDYTYSAKQREEVQKIRARYAPAAGADKLDELRRLDRSVTRPASIAAGVLGVVSTLLLGVGMCCTMVWAESMFVPGIAIGALGIVGAVLSPAVYRRMVRRRRERLAPEILRLSDELLSE